MIGAIICLIVTQDIMVTLFSAFIGIGMACTYALIFPLTFKFGPENSNVIMLTTAVAVALFYPCGSLLLCQYLYKPVQ